VCVALIVRCMRDSLFINSFNFRFMPLGGAVFSAAFSIFSINMPYPVVGSLTRTWVSAPTSLPPRMIGLPDTSVVNKGQQNHNFKRMTAMIPNASAT